MYAVYSSVQAQVEHPDCSYIVSTWRAEHTIAETPLTSPLRNDMARSACSRAVLVSGSSKLLFAAAELVALQQKARRLVLTRPGCLCCCGQNLLRTLKHWASSSGGL